MDENWDTLQIGTEFGSSEHLGQNPHDSDNLSYEKV